MRWFTPSEPFHFLFLHMVYRFGLNTEWRWTRSVVRLCVFASCCCGFTRLALKKKPWNIDECHSLPAAPLICISGTDFQLWVLQKGLKHAHMWVLSLVSYCSVTKAQDHHAQSHTQWNILPYYGHQRGPIWTSLRPDYLPPKHFAIFPLWVCEEESQNGCPPHSRNFMPKNAPWKYMLHFTFGTKAQTWNNTSKANLKIS